jgi:hypothetical protein
MPSLRLDIAPASLPRIAIRSASVFQRGSGVRWDRLLPGAYRNAKFLEEFEERGTPVTVTRGTTVRGELELIR